MDTLNLDTPQNQKMYYKFIFVIPWVIHSINAVLSMMLCLSSSVLSSHQSCNYNYTSVYQIKTCTAIKLIVVMTIVYDQRLNLRRMKLYRNKSHVESHDCVERREYSMC